MTGPQPGSAKRKFRLRPNNRFAREKFTGIKLAVNLAALAGFFGAWFIIDQAHEESSGEPAPGPPPATPTPTLAPGETPTATPTGPAATATPTARSSRGS